MPNLYYLSSSAILKYLVCKYQLPDHWYPSDVQRQAKVDEYLGWHGTNLRKGLGASMFYKVLYVRLVTLLIVV